MSISLPTYCTREAVKTALDAKETARSNAAVDRAIEAASRSVEALCNRVFYPTVATRYWDWPTNRSPVPWKLWLDQNELVSLTSLVAGGVTISPSNVNLEPNEYGPPYDRIEVKINTSAAFSSGPTFQRAIAVTGVFGFDVRTEQVGTVAEAMDLTETGMDVSAACSAAVGVGDLLLLDSERMLVTDRSMLSTGATGTLAAQASAVTLAVSDGTLFAVGEVLLIDSERVLVVDIAGNNLTVKRAWDGSVLAAHSGATIYAPRTLTVTRGALGTTAATHTTGTALYRQLYPATVVSLALAEAENEVLQVSSGYARTVGSGESERNASGAGLNDVRARCYSAVGRMSRYRGVR